MASIESTVSIFFFILLKILSERNGIELVYSLKYLLDGPECVVGSLSLPRSSHQSLYAVNTKLFDMLNDNS